MIAALAPLCASTLVGCGGERAAVDPLTPALEAPTAGLDVYHLGHSLVGRDMPAMVEQLAGAAGFAEHGHASQLGWGTSLRSHLGPNAEIAGFAEENAHPRHRPAREALTSGAYDALVLTEMVELRDALRYHDGAESFRTWTELARDARPGLRVYLYETWHELDDLAAWLERLDRDPSELWEGELLAPTWSAGHPVHVIPAGRVLARLARELDARGGVDGLPDVQALFQRDEAGELDRIHLNDLGHQLVALVHVAVLYQVSVRDLPHDLLRADGSAATAPSEAAARLMREVVDEVVGEVTTTGWALPDDAPATTAAESQDG